MKIASFLVGTTFLMVLLPYSTCEDPEIKMNVSQIINYWGYPCENHDVITDDGYILSVQRIPHGRVKTTTTTTTSSGTNIKPVVYLQHGLLGSSVHFVLDLYNESLGFLLADQGYDVWLGNSRGNDYSKRHKTLSPDSDAFWDFSWDDMAEYDLPATITHILNKTGATKLSYIGHSQGTTIAFAKFSQNTSLASKIDIFIALAPVAYVSNMESPIKYLAKWYPEVELLFKILGVRDFDLPKLLKDLIAELTCDTSLGEVVCSNVVFLLCGYDKAQLNETRLPVYTAQIIAGTSVKDIIHWSENVENKKFCKFDYGSEGNMKHYGQNTPPSYNVSNLHIPTALFTGGNDWLSDPKDVERLIPELTNIVFNFNIEAWDHLDFLVGKDAPKLVYSKIIKLLKQYSTKQHSLA